MDLAETLRSRPSKEHIQRLSVVKEAIEWLGTPYVAEARLKGIGTDCGEFLAGVFIEAGLIEPFKVKHHSLQWHLHTSDELYIQELAPFCREFDGPPLAGDIAMFHVKKAYAHAGIVIDWPGSILHCSRRSGVQWGDASRDAFLIMESRQFPPKFFSYWAHA